MFPNRNVILEPKYKFEIFNFSEKWQKWPFFGCFWNFLSWNLLSPQFRTNSKVVATVNRYINDKNNIQMSGNEGKYQILSKNWQIWWKSRNKAQLNAIINIKWSLKSFICIPWHSKYLNISKFYPLSDFWCKRVNCASCPSYEALWEGGEREPRRM